MEGLVAMFKVVRTGENVLGNLIYDKSEYSFDFKPVKTTDTVLMIGYLHMGINSETMLAQQVWGYNPYTAWTEKGLIVPNYCIGELRFEGEIQSGSSKRLVEVEQWATSYDVSLGWICIGDDSFSQNDVVVEFATNTLACINGGVLKSIWLKPLFTNE